MRCVLHIGTEKTASTTIQKFVYANRAPLEDQGVALSDVLGKTNNRKLVACFQVGFDDFHRERHIQTQEQKTAFFNGFAESFEREVESARQESDIFFISSEHFHSRLSDIDDISRLQQFIDKLFTEVKIVCYFREQSEVVTSLYSTSIRSGNSGAFEDFLKKAKVGSHYFDYQRFFSKWKEVFGKDRLYPRLFQKDALFEQDIRKDVLKAIGAGINLEHFDFDMRPSNRTLSWAQLELGRIINKRYLTHLKGGKLNLLRGMLMGNLVGSSLSSLGSLSNPNAKLIYDSFDESNRAFALEFFDVQGNPFESPCTDSVGINEQVDSSHLMELFCAFFDELLADVIGNKPIEDYHADAHRDIALKYERNEPLSLQDAVYLMEVAHKLRPKGPLIKNKMDEYRKLMTEAEQQMPGPGVAWE